MNKYYAEDVNEYRESEVKKHSFKEKADNAVKSLKEVEYFLANWKKIAKGIKLYNVLK